MTTAELPDKREALSHLDYLIRLAVTNEIDALIVELVRARRAAVAAYADNQLEQDYASAWKEVADDQTDKVKEVLPPIVGSTRQPKSIDVPCPTCFAPKNKPCFEMSMRGPHGSPTDKLRKGYHKTRTQRARGQR